MPTGPEIKIPINKAGHHYSTSVCIEFEAIYDVPFGIIRTIRNTYNDPSIFNQRWMKYDNYTLRTVLYERTEYNPVLSAMINKDKAKADSILMDFYKIPKAHREVLDNSPFTNIASFLQNIMVVKSGQYGDVISYIVICKNKTQVDKIKEDFPEVHTSCDGLDFDVKLYDLIILEKFENILQYHKKHKSVMGKHIWMPEFAYNMDLQYTDRPDLAISTIIGDVNKISTYEPYSNFIKPVG